MAEETPCLLLAFSFLPLLSFTFSFALALGVRACFASIYRLIAAIPILIPVLVLLRVGSTTRTGTRCTLVLRGPTNKTSLLIYRESIMLKMATYPSGTLAFPPIGTGC